MRNYLVVWAALAAVCVLLWWALLVWIGWIALLIIPAVGVIVHYLTREK
jgi:hypothetical protein